MLVDVIEIRRKGERLEVEEMRALTPVRGMLKLAPTHAVWYREREHPRLLALLVDAKVGKSLLRPLDRARVTRVQKGALLIVGVQQEGERERDLYNVTQEWVARPVAESPDVQPLQTASRTP